MGENENLEETGATTTETTEETTGVALKDLIAVYNGNIVVNVSKVVTDGVVDVVNFETEDADAIKDEILNATIKKLEVKVANNVKAIATLDVVI